MNRNIAILVFFLGLGLVSCLNNESLTVDQLKQGSFKTVLDEQEVESIAHRMDSIQIEEYEGKLDTFYIHWEDDFQYVLRHKHPKNALDSTAFYVQITALGKDYYTFRAYYYGSNFEQTGKAYKLDAYKP